MNVPASTTDRREIPASTTDRREIPASTTDRRDQPPAIGGTTDRRDQPPAIGGTTDRQRFLDGLAAFQRSLYRVGIDPAAVTIVLQPNDKDKLLHALDLIDWDDITAPGRPTRLRGTIIDEAKS